MTASGGSWYNKPQNLRAACRNGYTPASHTYNSGLRVARTLNPTITVPHGAMPTAAISGPPPTPGSTPGIPIIDLFADAPAGNPKAFAYPLAAIGGPG